MDPELAPDLARFALDNAGLSPSQIRQFLSSLYGEDGRRLAGEIFRFTAPPEMLKSGRRPDLENFYLELVGRLGLAAGAPHLETQAAKISAQFWLDA